MTNLNVDSVNNAAIEDIPDRIRTWLKGFDSIIDAVARDPVAVKRDGFLRRAFEYAFAPEWLPSDIAISVRGEVDSLDSASEPYRPYYLAQLTRKAKTEKSGEEKVTSRLVLHLKNLDGTWQALKDYHLLRVGSESPPNSGRPTKIRKNRGEYGELARIILQVRKSRSAELAQLDALERQASDRKDSTALEQYRRERRHVIRQIEDFGADF